MIRENIWLIFVTIILILTNCPSKEPTLTFAVGGAPSEVDYWEKLIKEFEMSTGVKVKTIRQPTDTDQRRQGLIIPLRAKKNDPDVFLMDVVWVAQFAASDWLLSLDSYFKYDDLDLNNFFAMIVKQVDIYKDKLVALPVYNDCGMLYYRKDLLKKHKLPVPTTWKELVEIAIKIQSQERKENPQFYGFTWQGAQYEGLICTFLEFTVSHNGGIVDKSGNIELVRSVNIEALEFMKDLIHKYKISPPNTFTEMKEEEVRLFFENGNALFERNWPYAWGLHKREESPVKNKLGITILPAFKGGKNAAALGGWHIGISKYSDTKDNAWKLVKFIISYDTQKKLALNLGWNPGRSDIYDIPEIEEEIPHMSILKKAFENSVARPNLPYYTQISEILQRNLNTVLSDKISPKEALKKSQDEIDKVIKMYHE